MTQVLETEVAGEMPKTMTTSITENKLEKQVDSYVNVLEYADLTFDQIAPLWSRKLGIIRTNKQRQQQGELEEHHNTSMLESSMADILDMNDYACCVVGEAHGFTSNYTMPSFPEYCDSCSRTAAAFGVFAKPKRNMVKVRAMIKYFMEHFNQAHKQEFYERYSNYNVKC
jgi:hypothetical protein